MEIINVQMQEDGQWKGQVVLDGKVCKFICTNEFIEDRITYLANLNTIKTSNFTNDEITSWEKYNKMLSDPSFWEGARSRVKIIKNYQ